MEELVGSEIIFDVEEGVKIGEELELAKDMLTIFVELVLLMQVHK